MSEGPDEKMPFEPESIDAAPADQLADDPAASREEPAAEERSSNPKAEGEAPLMEPPAVIEEDEKPEDTQQANDVITQRIAERDANRQAADAAILAQSRAYTRRSFFIAGAAAAAGVGFYQWLDSQPMDERQPNLLRRAFETNASVTRTIGREEVLAPTYPIERAETLRVNGIYGLKRELLPDSYRLQVVGSRDPQRSARFVPDVTAWDYRYTEARTKEDEGHDTKVAPKAESAVTSAEKMAPGDMMQKAEADENHAGRKTRGTEEAGESQSTLRPNTSGLLLTMQDVLQLPRHEFVTQFKCIEGWSQFVQWAGVRLADFIEAYPPALIDGKEPRYVYMETPDGDYYTGYDMVSCRHPQALLVTEMMGAPLTQSHGAPLRLHMPNKYGYKQIKRIALISYTNDKPDDYWTKLGYDWYAGL